MPDTNSYDKYIFDDRLIILSHHLMQLKKGLKAIGSQMDLISLSLPDHRDWFRTADGKLEEVFHSIDVEFADMFATAILQSLADDED